MSVALDEMLAKSPDVCGGRIRIDGTRITVERIATLYKQGQSSRGHYTNVPTTVAEPGVRRLGILSRES